MLQPPGIYQPIQVFSHSAGKDKQVPRRNPPGVYQPISQFGLSAGTAPHKLYQPERQISLSAGKERQVPCYKAQKFTSRFGFFLIPLVTGSKCHAATSQDSPSLCRKKNAAPADATARCSVLKSFRHIIGILIFISESGYAAHACT